MGMTVEQLRQALVKVPGHIPVILARDPEGNGFLPLCDMAQYYYSPSTGDCVMLDELEEYGQDDSALALCLWP